MDEGVIVGDVVARGERFVIVRSGQVMGVQLIGQLSPPDVAAWLAAARGEFQRNGYPRFAAFDLQRLEPVESMSSRFRVATFAREALPKVTWAVILARPASAAQLVAKVVLRVAGMSNVTLLDDEAAFRAAVGRMLLGQPPSPGV